MPVTNLAYLRQTFLATGGAAAIYLAAVACLTLAGYEIMLFSIIPDFTTKVILFLLLVPGVFCAFYWYPFIVAQGRKTKIDLDLPYAVTYMQALSTTMTLCEIVRRVYDEMDLFGEVSKEFGLIVRDIEIFGEDLYTAMRSLQHVTPSKNLEDFLNDLILLSDSGGDITAFLAARADYFRDVAEREMEMSMKTIEIMAEVYVTAFVAGPIVIMIMVLSQNLAGQNSLSAWMPLIILGIPLGALVMIGLLYTLLPGENLRITRKEIEDKEFLDELQFDQSTTRASPDLIRNLQRKRQSFEIQKALKQPFRHYISNYQWSLMMGSVFGCTVAYLALAGTLTDIFPYYTLEVTACLLSVACMLPVMVAYEGRRWYVNRIEHQMPEFLRELADMKDIGMTIQGAIHRIAGTKLGVLSSELQMTSEELRRGRTVNTALVRMEERIGLISVKRAISLVVKASEVTDYLREILMIAISDFDHYLKMKKERFNAAFTYVVVIYLSFGVFLYTAYQMNTQFVASFMAFNVNLDISGNVADMFHIAIVLAAFSGIMAGQFSSSSILAGLKHSIVFLVAAVALFTYIAGGI